ncbi:MAG: hypothetical protein ABIJ56_01135 [Pseudomonadota bacterium]
MMKARYVLFAILAASCGNQEAGEEIPESATTLAMTATTATETAAALGTPLVESTAEFNRDRPGDTEVREEVEDAVAENSIVTDPGCVTFEWDRLTATVTFTGCETELNNLALDGTVILTVTVQPEASIRLAFDDLSVDGHAFSGSIGIESSGTRENPEVTLTASLTWTSSDGAATIVFDGATVAMSEEQAVISGEGHVTTSSLDSDFTMSGLTWKRGECLPTSGSISYTENSKTIVITFLETTPGTGVVQVTVGSLPARDVEMFEPCGA